MTGIGAEPGSTILLVADAVDAAVRVLGPLRLHLAERLGLIGEGWNLLWLTAFPMFEWVAEEKRWKAAHNPFSAPEPEDEADFESDPPAARARQYDLVLNGNEIGGGSIRNHKPEVQKRVFRMLGISDVEAEEKFSFLLRALEMGAPPHGGIAFGIDRLAMLLAGAASLRDVTAFPKGQGGVDPLTGAPTPATRGRAAPVRNQGGDGTRRDRLRCESRRHFRYAHHIIRRANTQAPGRGRSGRSIQKVAVRRAPGTGIICGGLGPPLLAGAPRSTGGLSLHKSAPQASSGLRVHGL